MKLAIFTFLILALGGSAIAGHRDAVFAILKLSYNVPGETPVTGGITGSAFLINNNTILTAYHVLNKKTGPNPGFKYCQFWLLKRGKNKLVLPLKNVSFKYLPQIDTTVIQLKTPLSVATKIRLQNIDSKIGDDIYNIGHIGNTMPEVDAKWENNLLVVHDYSLQENNTSDRYGTIANIETADIRSNDLNISGIIVIKPSFGAVVGMSGGPLFNKKNNKLIGLMSFGFPPDKDIKDEVYAISVNEIIRLLNSEKRDNDHKNEKHI